MYCSGCGRELPNDVRFCPSCGTKVSTTSAGIETRLVDKSGSVDWSDSVDWSSPVEWSDPVEWPVSPEWSEPIERTNPVNEVPSPNTASGAPSTTVNTDDSMMRLIEAGLSVALAIFIVFGQMISINYYIDSMNVSVLGLLSSLSDLASLVGSEVSDISGLPVLIIAMCIGCVCAAVNALEAFQGVETKGLTLSSGTKIPISAIIGTTIYAVGFAMLLNVLKEKSFGIVSANGYTWLMLALALVVQVLNFIRCSKTVS